MNERATTPENTRATETSDKPETTSIDVLDAARMYLRIARKELESIDREIFQLLRGLARHGERATAGAGASNAGQIAFVLGDADRLRDLGAKRQSVVAQCDTLHEIITQGEPKHFEETRR